MNLKTEISKILEKSTSLVQLPEQKGFNNGQDWALNELLSLFQKEMLEIIGEDEYLNKNTTFGEHSIEGTAFIDEKQLIRNNLRREQRQRIKK